MLKARLAGRGEEYHPDVPPAALGEMHRSESPGKSKDMPQAAVLEWRSRTLGEMGRIAGRRGSTVHGWLLRLKREGLGRRYGRRSLGRPRLPAPGQERAVGEDLDRPPPEGGFSRGSWNSKMLAGLIGDWLGIACSRRTALGIADRLGFSACRLRSTPCNGATPGEQEFIEKTRAAIDRWKAEGRAAPAVDAATVWDSTTSGRDHVRFRAYGSGMPA